MEYGKIVFYCIPLRSLVEITEKNFILPYWIQPFMLDNVNMFKENKL